MKIKLVQKNSGYRQKFDLAKLKRSIAAAMRNADASIQGLPERVAHEAKERLEAKNSSMVTVIDVTEAVLHVLREDKLSRIADAYEFVSLRMSDPHIIWVLKRDGSKQHFHPYKLFKSLKKSFAQQGVAGAKLAEELTKEVASELKRGAHDTMPAEKIRDLTAKFLAAKGFKNVEKSYLLHKYV